MAILYRAILFKLKVNDVAKIIKIFLKNILFLARGETCHCGILASERPILYPILLREFDRRPCTNEARIRSKANTGRLYCEQSSTATGVSEYFGINLSESFHRCSIFIFQSSAFDII